MSHSKERKEKICLNCHAELNGRFCHLCGQENLEPKESVWGLITHFFYDITHFDGKFFTTLGYLLRRPGFLSKEYIRGRRASYLNPIRMYVFTSALFFIIFFSMFSVRSWNIDTKLIKSESERALETSIQIQEALKTAKTHADSVRIEALFTTLQARLDSTGKLVDSLRNEENDDDNDDSDDSGKGWKLSLNNSGFTSKAAYDSVQRAKPPAERDGWLSRKINYRFIELNKRYEGQEKQFLRDLFDKFLHTFPYLLFVSLPLYALFLKLLYVRRKQFYYVDHGIFLVHLYIFTFIVLLILFGLYKLNDITEWGWIGWLQAALMIYGVIYTVKAMRNFYGQGWTKTIIKFILLNFLAFISLIFLFALFFVLTVFRI